jgi:cation diffusion facilitator CzcD-associated flavoprotein CzcO
MAGVSKRVAVIGAGAAGLSTAKHLLHLGIDVTVYEMGSQVGGLWVYENDNGRSPAYDSLYINSEAQVTQYRDYPFPEGTPIFPSHRQIRQYLESYADHFDVRRHIRFNTEVTSVEPADGAGWNVALSDGGREHFDAVVVACGHQADPAHPPFAETFGGEYLHAHSYRIPDPFRGKRVLVVGTGNSGLDIAADVCGVTEATIVAARSPVLIMPRTLFGVPTARALANLRVHKLPWPVQRRIRELVTWVVHGRMEQYGLRTPKTRTHPAGHQTFMSHVAYQRIRIRPGIASVEGKEVRFTDGSVEEVDTIIAATGYELELPFLPEDIAPIRGRRLDAYKRVLHVDRPDLYFVGFFNVSGGANIRMMDVQAEWVAALVAGTARRPSREEMLEDIEQERRTIAKRFPGSPRYGLELDPIEYPASIAAELGASPG